MAWWTGRRSQKYYDVTVFFATLVVPLPLTCTVLLCAADKSPPSLMWIKCRNITAESGYSSTAPTNHWVMGWKGVGGGGESASVMLLNVLSVDLKNCWNWKFFFWFHARTPSTYAEKRALTLICLQRVSAVTEWLFEIFSSEQFKVIYFFFSCDQILTPSSSSHVRKKLWKSNWYA